MFKIYITDHGHSVSDHDKNHAIKQLPYDYRLQKIGMTSVEEHRVRVFLIKHHKKDLQL
jgi:hypothetical protein